MSILIAEDEAMIALGLAYAVEDVGGDVVGPVGTVAEAMDHIYHGDISAAILDVDLQDRDITPVVRLLTERAVPFVLHTGTGVPAEVATISPQPCIVMKPALARNVVEALLIEIEMTAMPA